MSTRRLLLFCLLLVSMPAAGAAALHAFLDRSQVNLGDTVTLNVDGVGTTSAAPDLSPLRQDFEVLGTSSSSSVQIVNSTTRSSTLWAVALRPRHPGTLTVPPLDFGGARTPALTLQVVPASAGAHGHAGGDTFLEASVGQAAPYVGEQTLYTLRLFYAPGLNSGELADPQANGAQVIRLNGDTRYQTERNGKTYEVLERHYALIAQRAGRIDVQGPAFHGEAVDAGNPNSLFDSMFGEGKPVDARADDITLDARAIPAGSGTPWLPAQSVTLSLNGLPADGRVKAGVPLTVTLGIDAVGQPADRLPEPQLPSIDGAHVYPDKPQDVTRDDGHWLHGSRTRSFAIVPTRNGTLTLPAITLNWWDVVHDRAEQARIPQHSLSVIGAVAVGAVGTSSAAPSSSSAQPAPGTTAHVMAGDAANHAWRDVAIASAVLWIIALTALAWWLLHRRSRRAARGQTARSAAASRVDSRHLQRSALDAARSGDPVACERALLSWARCENPALHHAGALRDALADPGQLAALEQLQRARWKGGDGAIACRAVAEAFAHGFVWRDEQPAVHSSDDGLPPLYPS